MRLDASDYIAAGAVLVSAIALFISIEANKNSYQLQTAQNGITVISVFANRDVVDAAMSAIDWSEKLPRNKDELMRFRKDTGPLKQALSTLAECLVHHACDGEMVKDVFCAKAEGFDGILTKAHASAGVPLFTASDADLKARRLCERG